MGQRSLLHLSFLSINLKPRVSVCVYSMRLYNLTFNSGPTGFDRCFTCGESHSILARIGDNLTAPLIFAMAKRRLKPCHVFLQTSTSLLSFNAISSQELSLALDFFTFPSLDAFEAYRCWWCCTSLISCSWNVNLSIPSRIDPRPEIQSNICFLDNKLFLQQNKYGLC